MCALMRICGFSKSKMHAQMPVRISKMVTVAPDVQEEQFVWSMELLNLPPPLHVNTSVTRPHQLQKRTAIEDLLILCENFFNMVGDSMPDCDEIHMPSYLSSSGIHTEYLNDMNENGFDAED